MKAMKAKAKASPKARASPKAKGKAKAKAKAGAKLTAKALAQKEYEEMTLEEKVAKIKEEHPDNEEEQAAALKKALTKQEHSKLWSQHQTGLKHNPDEAGALDGLAKGDKGLAKSLWFLRKSEQSFTNVAQHLEKGKVHQEREKWLSEKQVMQNFEQ